MARGDGVSPSQDPSGEAGMIQFNLLPDVKQEFIKARRAKRSVGVIATLSAVGALALLLIMVALVHVAQKKHLSDLNKDIDKYSHQLSEVPDLNKILTIQNQLSSLPALHEEKPTVSRLFGYMTQVTPTDVSLDQVRIDFEAGGVTVLGTADRLETINKFVDTLKFTKFKVDEGEADKNAFTEVVLVSFSRDDKGAGLQVTFKYDPEIFDSTKKISLDVPKIVSTRSETEQPKALFGEGDL
jgi:hypothetical protein